MDLGSNSFHMVVGELRHGQLAIIDRLKETVRLSEGLGSKGALGEDARRRALDCLARFGERIRDMRASSVRVAGTSALRRASDSGNFIEEAEQALGHPIEIISGIEEARLIYMGVLHSTPPTSGRRLVLDIGGGSTELILGSGDSPLKLESLHMGCVLMTEKHFPDGRLTRGNFDAARMAVRLKLRPVKTHFRVMLPFDTVGTSGTILATELVARQTGIIESGELTTAAVNALIEQMLAFNSIDELSLRGLPERRAQVWPGGLAILIELLEGLRIERLRVSDGALREGLLYDQLGRLQHQDARERSVQALATRYNVDRAQATRVAETAAGLLLQVATNWQLQSALASDALGWAAMLHEIGLDIAHNGFQRHGAYIAANADLPGFPRSEQNLLAFLIATQRSDISESRLRLLPSKWRRPALRLAILLRLAVLLNRSRMDLPLPNVDIAVGEQSVNLVFQDEWLQANPLTAADLERERQYLARIEVNLAFT